MKEIITITKQQNGNQVISARELYNFLTPKTEFRHWIKRMLEYGFEENKDYYVLPVKNDRQTRGGHNAVDYVLTLDTAKEISMIQRSDKGKQARCYFIEKEKELKQQNKPQKNKAEILLESVKLLVEHEKRITENEDRINELEAKTTTRPDYYSIVGYATLRGIKVPLKKAQSIGKKASNICKSKGIITDEIPDPRFGKVKLYPQSILKQLFQLNNNNI